MDLISGSWPGQISLFAGTEDGGFAAPTQLLGVDGQPIHPGRASTAFAVDWNGDGRLDILGGNIGGEVLWFGNASEGDELRFAPGVKLRADGQVIAVPRGDSGPAVVDWNGNGHPDLLVGCGDGSVRWYRNLGTTDDSGLPQLAAAEVLIAPDRQGPRGTRVKVHPVDWNGNGQLDLLVGDYFRRQVQGASPEDLEQEPVWRREIAQLETATRVTRRRAMREVRRDRTEELSDKEQERLVDQHLADNADYQSNTARLAELQGFIQGLRPRSVSGGHVWVFLRSTPE